MLYDYGVKCMKIFIAYLCFCLILCLICIKNITYMSYIYQLSAKLVQYLISLKQKER